MVELVTALRLVGGLLLLLANGFFVTTEFALTRVRQFSAEQFEGPGLSLAWRMTERLEIYLSGCQLGITVSSVGLGVVAEPAVAAVLDPAVRAVGFGAVGAGGHTAASVVVALAVINLLHLVVGEQAPTYLGVERTRQIAKYGAPPLYAWTKLTWPVILLADRFSKALLRAAGVDMTRSWTEEGEPDDERPTSRGELRREMGEALREFGLPADRRTEVLNALEIGETPVESVMVDRDDVVALGAGDGYEAVAATVRRAPHSRYPLVDGDIDAFEGVLYTPALLQHVEALEAGETTLEALAAPPVTVDAEAPVADVIDRFQDAGQELAVVTRDGRAVGVVTATDCLEAITGELEDPLDGRLPSAA